MQGYVDWLEGKDTKEAGKVKLYEELKDNGYKTLYSDTYIPREKLFSKEFFLINIKP